jgi:hypothetical protein
MKRLVVGLLSVACLAFAVPAAANPPVEEPILDVFPDINPCSGEEMTVTFVGSVRVHEHGNRVIAIAQRTITTSDGFEGHGVDSFVDNGQVLKSTLTDILTNEATGQRFRARFRFVLDLSTDTVRVDRGGLTCLGRKLGAN